MFSSIQPLDQLGHLGDMRDNSAEILFQSFLQEALVSSSGMGRDVYSLMSIQHFLCWPQHCSPSKMPWRMVLRGCCGTAHAQTIQVSVSWQLQEAVPVDLQLQGSWSCSSSSHWSCGPSRRCREVWYGVFPAWYSLGTSWTGLLRVSISYGHILLSWRTLLADCSRGLHC